MPYTKIVNAVDYIKYPSVNYILDRYSQYKHLVKSFPLYTVEL